jgi:uncharacterized protein (DUF1330 family)
MLVAEKEIKSMSVYVVINIDVRDSTAYEEYKTKVSALILKHGGEYVVRGGKVTVLEGDWRPDRLVMLRFPDLGSVQALIDDPEYQPLKALRHRVCKTEMIVVEGL